MVGVKEGLTLIVGVTLAVRVGVIVGVTELLTLIVGV